MLKNALNKDVLAGLMFTGIGLGAVVAARDYDIGTASQMGAGYFPVLLGSLLTLFGVVIAVRGLRSSGVDLDSFGWRPFCVVLGTLVLFGLLLETGGFLLTALLVVVGSRFARPGYGWRETLLLGVVLALACAALFSYGLSVQMPLLPQID